MERSIGRTCKEAHVTGIRVDDTAVQSGTDWFAFDGVFANGRVHVIVKARNR